MKLILAAIITLGLISSAMASDTDMEWTPDCNGKLLLDKDHRYYIEPSHDKDLPRYKVIDPDGREIACDILMVCKMRGEQLYEDSQEFDCEQ